MAATSGVSTVSQVRSGIGRSAPSASVTLSISFGWQCDPPLATVAKAPAMARGETLSLPMTSLAFSIVIGLPSPVVPTPIFFATLAMSQRSSCAAIAR